MQTVDTYSEHDINLTAKIARLLLSFIICSLVHFSSSCLNGEKHLKNPQQNTQKSIQSTQTILLCVKFHKIPINSSENGDCFENEDGLPDYVSKTLQAGWLDQFFLPATLWAFGHCDWARNFSFTGDFASGNFKENSYVNSRNKVFFLT